MIELVDAALEEPAVLGPQRLANSAGVTQAGLLGIGIKVGNVGYNVPVAGLPCVLDDGGADDQTSKEKKPPHELKDRVEDVQLVKVSEHRV